MIAQAMREKSKQETSEKAEDIMDVNDDAVKSVFIDNQVNMLIHGHTHRPMVHSLSINEKPATRIVLGDWYKKGSYLEFNSTDDFSLKDFY